MLGALIFIVRLPVHSIYCKTAITLLSFHVLSLLAYVFSSKDEQGNTGAVSFRPIWEAASIVEPVDRTKA